MDYCKEIQKYLPHQPPMLMVDDILSMNEKEIITSFRLRKDNLFVQNGVFSESGIIENAAQTCSAIIGRPFFSESAKKKFTISGYISKIKYIEIFFLPKVNSVIQTHAELISFYEANNVFNCTMKCKTNLNDKLVSEGDIQLLISAS